MKRTVLLALLCAALSGVDVRAAEVAMPFAALRFGSEFTTETNWPGMRRALAVNRGAFDEVWFSTGVSYPPLKWHEERAAICARAAADLREIGIVPSIEIQTIIGHTDGIMAGGDCSGRTWETWVGWDGRRAKHCGCPRAPGLRAYFVRVAELHAAWKPGAIWVDDDIAVKNRAPSSGGKGECWGCWCPRCLAAFAKTEGREWSREELLGAIAADTALKERWLKSQVEGLAELVRDIAAAVRRVSPDTRMGYQFGWGHRRIAEALHVGSGAKVRIRPGSWWYWDSDPRGQIRKAYELARNFNDMIGAADWIEGVCPEIESCPRTFCCRTPQGVILEAFEHLAMGMDFLSMFIADARAKEDVRFYERRLFPRMAAAHGFLLEFRDLNRGARPCGFTVKGGVPADLVACRGIPIVAGRCQSLGELPSVGDIPARLVGAGDMRPDNPAYQTQVMQVAAGPSLMEFARRCDEASGGKLPILFDEPVMAWVVPNVREDGSLATVAVVNACIDRQEPVTVRLRGVPTAATHARWHVPETATVAIPLVRDGESVRAMLPRIGAWECGFLSFEQ